MENNLKAYLNLAKILLAVTTELKKNAQRKIYQNLAKFVPKFINSIFFKY